MSLFYETLDDILLLKPESVVNPYLKSMGKDRKHDVSDSIESINEKIAKSNIFYCEYEEEKEDIEPKNVQLSFKFDDD